MALAVVAFAMRTSGMNNQSNVQYMPMPVPVPVQVPVPFISNRAKGAPYPMPTPVDRPVVFPVHVKTSASPSSIHRGHDSLDIFARPVPVIPTGLLPTPQVRDMYGNPETPC